MVDIHAHVLWGLDDGAETYEESLAMLQAAAAAGTTDIVATPHADPRYLFDPEQIETRIARLESSGVTLPRLHRGCDFHLSFDNVQSALEEPGKFTIDHGNYLLVEFPDVSIPDGIDGVLTQFLDRGIVPVITHPERNRLLMRDLPQLAARVEKGCLLQVTALSFLGRFGSRARDHAWKLMDRRLVHAVASDAHDPVRRHARLDEARAEVARRAGEGNAELLFVRNPGTIVAGRHPAEIVRMSEFRRRWFLFRR